VTGGTVDWRLDVLRLDPLKILLNEIIRVLIPHRRDFGIRPDVLLRGVVTLQTPSHGKGFGLEYNFHLIDTTVAALTTNAIVGVDRVAEPGVVRQLVDLDPLDRLTRCPAFTNREQLERLGTDLGMAIHTRLGGRHIRVRSVLDVGMAILTVETQLADMKSVTVFNWLFGGVTDVRVLG